VDLLVQSPNHGRQYKIQRSRSCLCLGKIAAVDGWMDGWRWGGSHGRGRGRLGGACVLGSLSSVKCEGERVKSSAGDTNL